MTDPKVMYFIEDNVVGLRYFTRTLPDTPDTYKVLEIWDRRDDKKKDDRE